MKKILFALVLILLSSVCFADEYVTVMCKKETLCQHMLKLYNEDLKKYGKVKYEHHKEFNWIKWEDKGIRLRPASEPTVVGGISAKIALFDINNDSKDEVIFYHPSMQSNQPIDVYDIFPCEVLTMLKEKKIIDGETLFSKIMNHFTSSDGIPVNVYDINEQNIKKLSKNMQEFIVGTKERGDKDEYFVGLAQKVIFLKFNNRYYIVFEGPRGIGPGEDWEKVEKYSVISEYQQDNTLKHQCLYLIKKDKSSNKRRAK